MTTNRKPLSWTPVRRGLTYCSPRLRGANIVLFARANHPEVTGPNPKAAKA